MLPCQAPDIYPFTDICAAWDPVVFLRPHTLWLGFAGCTQFKLGLLWMAEALNLAQPVRKSLNKPVRLTAPIPKQNEQASIGVSALLLWDGRSETDRLV